MIDFCIKNKAGDISSLRKAFQVIEDIFKDIDYRLLERNINSKSASFLKGILEKVIVSDDFSSNKKDFSFEELSAYPSYFGWLTTIYYLSVAVLINKIFRDETIDKTQIFLNLNLDNHYYSLMDKYDLMLLFINYDYDFLYEVFTEVTDTNLQEAVFCKILEEEPSDSDKKLVKQSRLIFYYCRFTKFKTQELIINRLKSSGYNLEELVSKTTNKKTLEYLEKEVHPRVFFEKIKRNNEKLETKKVS